LSSGHVQSLCIIVPFALIVCHNTEVKVALNAYPFNPKTYLSLLSAKKKTAEESLRLLNIHKRLKPLSLWFSLNWR